MKLTEELKLEIDNMNYSQMLSKTRHAPIGDPLFSGESGDYFMKRMGELRAPDGDKRHTSTSKSVGWD